MYWWNASKLAEDLREGRVDEKERFNYYLATFIAWNIAFLLFIWFGGPISAGSLPYFAICSVVGVIGIILCYRVNKSGDDTDFIARMICLGWPVGVRYMVIFGSPLLASSLITFLPSSTLGPESFYAASRYQVWELWFFFLVIYFPVSYYSTIRAYLVGMARFEEGLNLGRTTFGVRDIEAVFPGLGVVGLQIMGILVALYGATSDFIGRNLLGAIPGVLVVALWAWIIILARRRSMKLT